MDPFDLLNLFMQEFFDDESEEINDQTTIVDLVNNDE